MNDILVTHGVRMLVADEAWCALASLHKDYPERRGFTAREILHRAEQRSPLPLRPGVQVHIYQHNVANIAPSSARYRMFFRLPDNTYRLYLPGDACDPQRKGKTKPEREDIPEKDRGLIDFYENEFLSRGREPRTDEDPLFLLRGVGKRMWTEVGGGDAYLRAERIAWDEDQDEHEMLHASPRRPEECAADDVWNRIVAHEGQVFHTSQRLPFTYRVEGDGIWPIREGHVINRKLLKTQIHKAIRKGRPTRVTDLSEFIDNSYLFSLLRDTRTCPKDWR